MMRRVEILFVFFIAVFLFLPLLSVQAQGVRSRTFSSDDDFNQWTLSNIELNGSDSGIRLKHQGSSYVKSGEATYKFTPGGNSKWVKATVSGDNLSGILLEYSANSSNYYQANSDGSFPGEIDFSQDLYIRAKINRSGTSSPILRSLKIEYENNSHVRVLIEKRIYNCELSSDGNSCISTDGRSIEKSTFEPGDVAAVSIKINSSSEVPVNFDLRDFLPAEAVRPVEVTDVSERSRYCRLDPINYVLTGMKSEGGRVEWRDLTASQSDQYLCYKFGIGKGVEDAKHKNIIKQTNIVAYNAGGSFDNIIGSSNNYLMVRGYPFVQSQEEPNLLDATAPYKINKIEDELAFAFTKVLFTNPDQIANSVPSYLYLRGSGQKSRGGTLVSLPVKMTDMSGAKTFFSDQFYLLYNPLFYIFGNMFSGSTPTSTAFDFGHGSSVVSTGDFGNEKLNSAASLYNYYFDQESVIFWDRGNQDKNAAMENNISRILGTESSRPDDLCVLPSLLSANRLSGAPPVYLNNKSCSLIGVDNSSVWPSGRVWYLKAISDIEISSTIAKGGTLVVDFSDASYVPTVKINTQENDFANDSFLGLIVINGGRVEFTADAEYFRGAVFVPGRSDSDPQRLEGEGRIIFAEDGRPLKIRGSLIADEIDFNKRQKNDKEYAVSVYSDSALVNSRIPGFEKLMSVLIGK